MKNKNLLWMVPIILMAIITPFTPAIDLEITRFFFHPENGIDASFSSGPFFDFFYTKGLLPGWILAILSVFTYLFSYTFKNLKKFREVSLVLILTLMIGSGFVTHFVLKDHWGRPRPKQVVEFGGTEEFRPFYSPNFFNQKIPNKSFPCGHCTMGFYFFGLAVAGMRLNKKLLMYFGFGMAFLLGGLLGFTRIAQGGHFFSDVLFGALVMWLTALGMDALCFTGKAKDATTSLYTSST